jgi:hypothetical protein
MISHKKVILSAFFAAGLFFARNAASADASITAPADLSKIKELDVTREDEETGKSIFTVHILPGKTKKFAKIEYEITYHQDFPFEDSRGRKYHKVHEPVVFKYSVKQENMVEDLDHYVNFRVPFGREQLELIYGKFAFHPQHPITVPRVIIRAYDGDKIAWQHAVEVNRSYIWDDKKQDLALKPIQPKK